MASMYPGGKNRHYQTIINQIPPHHEYIETHLGSGAILRHKRPAAANVGIDKNPAVIQAHATGNLAELEDIGISTVASCHQVATAHLPMGATNGTFTDGYRWTSVEMPIAAAIGKNTVPSAPAKIPLLHLICGDALDYLHTRSFTGREFVYADPPYVMHTRSSQRPLYAFEYTDEQHITLLKCLITLPCPVMISGYWSTLYADMLTGWRSLQFASYDRAGNQKEEWLWMNYPEPTRLHDYRYLGENFRKRDDLKRKKKRWVNRLKTMDILERRAILWAIEEAGLLSGA